MARVVSRRRYHIRKVQPAATLKSLKGLSLCRYDRCSHPPPRSRSTSQRSGRKPTTTKAYKPTESGYASCRDHFLVGRCLRAIRAEQQQSGLMSPDA